MRNFFSALNFLTVLPNPFKDYSVSSRMVFYFPLVGFLIGAFLIGVDRLCALFLADEIRVLMDLLFLIVVTGGLHLDGLADSADGFFSHKSKEKILEIMKDPRVGVMGAIALIFSVLLKFYALLNIPTQNCWLWMLITPAIARSSQVFGLTFMNYPENTRGLANDLYYGKSYKSLVGCVFPFLPIFVLNFWVGVLSIGIFILLTFFILFFFHQKIGGMTGDNFGALNEIIEICFFIYGGVVCPYTSMG